MKLYDENGKQIVNVHKPNIGLSIILSVLIPGLGQIYCGKIGRGVIILFGTTILWITIIGAIVAYFWQIYDAKKVAENLNNDNFTI